MTYDYRCPECGQGSIASRSIPGRKAIAFAGLEVELPSTLNLPTCDKCLFWSFPEDQSDEVDAAIAQGQLAWQAKHVPGKIAALRERHRITQQRLASALGVTPSHLSHVAAGTHAAKSTLLRLLHAFESNAAELDHVLQGLPLEAVEAKSAWTFAMEGSIANYGVAPSVKNFLYGSVRPSFEINFGVVEVPLGAQIEPPEDLFERLGKPANTDGSWTSNVPEQLLPKAS